MFVLPGYQIAQQVQVEIKNAIYRGIREKDSTQVIIKTLTAEFPTLEDITRLRHEYKITQNLHLEGVVRTYNLENAGNSYALIMEDLGGTSLKQLLAAKKPTLKEFLSIALQLATGLTELHQHRIIHKDIKPSNIIINAATKQLKLIDFSISTRLSRETPTINNAIELEGTLAYMSPEQTGRMNRTLDYRTDFYSLGVTCYEMLTGQLPFTSLDPLELVYSHIAKNPTPIQQLNPEVHNTISAIVMKLMAKNAEDRYQSAQGLKVDLEECLNQLQATGRIPHFTPGEKDKSGQFLIPQKLYGRESEVAALLEAFERVSAPLQPGLGGVEMMLVSGYSGIGKTSVVQEVHKPIVRQRGYFTTGKFDQFKRNIPYAAIIQAFSELIRQQLTETTEQIAVWKSELLEALGVNGQVIIDVIPEVELIIGSQPEVPQLEPTASQNRFNLVFKQFTSVFTKESHPLVLFLDDLQWADLASLKLIQLLMTDADSDYLLLIGAYRDNEVSPTHALMLTLEEIQKTQATVNNIVLQPLTLNTVNLIVADTLKESERSQELSRLIFNKTQGNPFFMNQLLQTLYAEKQLQFDFKQERWLWNLEEIQAIGITDYNVVQLVARNLQKLPEATQEALKLASCIGNSFYLDVLAIVSEQSQFTTADHLWEALQLGLLLPLSKDYKIPLLLDPSEQDATPLEEFRVGYKFLHDRVQQAAYSLIPEEQKKATHLKIGQLLLQQTGTYALEETVFDIVNQLNIGREFISQPSEKEELANLNLKAGKKAKTATAYEAAVRYLTVGLEMLPENSWQSQYELTLKIHVEAAEAEYLNTNFEAAEKMAEIVVQQATSLLDKVKVYELKIQFAIAQSQLIKAIEMGVSVLEMLGVSLSPLLSDGSRVAELPKLEKLESLPVMTNLYQLAVMRIFMNMAASAAIVNPTTFVQTILTMVNFCIEHGHSGLAAFAYVDYGMILCGAMADIDAGYYSGLLALKLLEKFDAKEIKSKVYAPFNGYIRHWKELARENIASLVEGIQSGLETGDYEYAGYCACHYSNHLIWVGEPLESVEKKQSLYLDLMQKIQQEFSITYIKVWHQFNLNLQGLAPDKLILVGSSFDEVTMLPYLQKYQIGLTLFSVYTSKAILGYLFKDYTKSLEKFSLAKAQEKNAVGMLKYASYNFYYSLAILAQFNNTNTSEKEQYLIQLEANQRQMQNWAHHAPVNYQHKYDLVEAEKARISGDLLKAQDYYDRAITGAKNNGYIQEEALANELAAEFYIAIGREKIAKIYITEAYYGYIRWGAIAKVTDLDERYPQLIFRTSNPEMSDIEITRVTASTRATNSTSRGSAVLDLASVMKAAQALSGEFALESLLSKLMTILIENAGAQKGYLILQQQSQLTVEVSALSAEAVTVQQIPLTNELLPLSAINYVVRSKQNLVLNSAANDSKFAADPYIQQHQPQSILCSPILNQGKLIGVIYLENNITTGAFTRERTEILNILCLQAAISLENAFLYSNLEQSNQQLEVANQQLAEYSHTLEAKVEERTAELKAAQKQIVAKEKLASLGTLTAGVAHELRNPLNFVNNFAESSVQLTEELIEEIENNSDKLDTESLENIKYILEELKGNASDINLHGKRAENIIKSMMMHARTESGQYQLTDLNELLAQAVDLAYHSRRAKDNRFNLTIETNYDGAIGQLELIASDLSRAFINLIDNACYAVHTKKQELGDSFNPTLRVKTENRGETVEITIADNGIGIESELQDKIFNPFFTTKPAGEGTGLGLSLTHDIIVGQHRGSIQLDTEQGRGTQFIISLPKTNNS
ncbi:ATP-binding sensor histidine kinase [Microcoleus sp. herbarium8]|uniref:trifunctional serine/threonine-protein kinase/ATP-binding protein/sensor histidine kinase n=1 Tax=Microcoleus sp. herbarium8 TaxID=3055436 RepID=UPI002FD3BCCE